jgi:hypothetical protein
MLSTEKRDLSMTYNLFTVDRLQPSGVTDVLASCLSVEPNAVDVADIDGEQELGCPGLL